MTKPPADKIGSVDTPGVLLAHSALIERLRVDLAACTAEVGRLTVELASLDAEVGRLTEAVRRLEGAA